MPSFGAKGTLYRVSEGQVVDKIDFQFTPLRMEQAFEASWRLTEGPGHYTPAAEFLGYTNGVETLSLRYHGLGEGRENDPNYIARMKAKIRLLVSPGPSFSLDAPSAVSPSRVMLIIGDRSESGVVESVRFSDILFNKNRQVIAFDAEVDFRPASRGVLSDVAFFDNLRRIAES